MRLLLKKAALTAQVACPLIGDIKASALRMLRTLKGEPHEKRFQLLRHLQFPDRPVFIDIGGDLGQTIDSLRIFRGDASIISFEPNPFSAAKTERRFRGVSGVEVRRVAVSDRDGECAIYIPAYKYTTFPELGTLDREDAGNWLASRIFGFDPVYQTVLEVRCPVQRLDSMSLAPSLIKIDCRCDVATIVAGGSETIAREKPVLLLEAALLSADTLAFLKGQQYRFFAFAEGGAREIAGGERCDLAVFGGNAETLAASAGRVGA